MTDYSILTEQILAEAPKFGFLEAQIAQIKIDTDSQNNFIEWLNHNFNGDMDYLTRNTELRFNPELLHDGTLSIITVKIPYLTQKVDFHLARLKNPQHAYISSYALGRDYHKVVKQQLKHYANWINQLIAQLKIEFNYRAFTDSAPILEVQLAQKSGNGWIGKNTLLLNKKQGSMFFLGELFTNLPLIPGTSTTSHCGSCSKCLTACPTNAFVAPYVLDARKCISYLTIENKESIPIEYRKAIGNRIYGCDDCQLVCPWNKFSQIATLPDFAIRHQLEQLDLIEAISWTEEEWRIKMQGSPIYRIGYFAWLRNVAVALGNTPTAPNVIAALKQHLNTTSPMLLEHIKWALDQHKIC